MEAPTKICAHCGRLVEYRRKWQSSWDRVRYCSAACRRASGRAIHRQLEEEILTRLAGRDAGSSICPSEVARAVFPESSWRSRMEDVRRAARRLAHRGEIRITQKGRTVDPAAFRGPIRLARVS